MAQSSQWKNISSHQPKYRRRNLSSRRGHQSMSFGNNMPGHNKFSLHFLGWCWQSGGSCSQSFRRRFTMEKVRACCTWKSDAKTCWSPSSWYRLFIGELQLSFLDLRRCKWFFLETRNLEQWKTGWRQQRRYLCLGRLSGILYVYLLIMFWCFFCAWMYRCWMDW